MPTLSQLIASATSQSQLSNLLEMDKFSIYAASTYLACDGVTDDYTDLYALINATINGDDAEIWFKDGTCLIGSSITIPTNIQLKFLNGGMLKPANSVTITGTNTKIDAGLYQIFDLSNGGTIAGTWNVREVYPEWFGAVGDGSIDDVSFLIDMFTSSIISGKKIIFSKPVYKIAGSQTILSSYSCKLIFYPYTYFDATTSTATPIINFYGTYGTFYLLGASPVKGATAITVHATLASTLAEGDIIRITTDSDVGGSGELWNSARAYYYKGELCEVFSVSGTTVTLKNALLDGYTAANTVVCKVSTINFESDNFALYANVDNAQVGLKIDKAKSVIINGGEIKGASRVCLDIENSYAFGISNMRASNFYKIAIGECYGIGIGSSQNGIIAGCKIEGGRHAISIGGREPARSIIIDSNPLLDSYEYLAIDAHGNTEFIKYTNNIILGAGGMSGINYDVSNNTFIDKVGQTLPHLYNFTEGAMTCDYAIIRNNTFKNNRTSDSLFYNIYFDVRNEYTIKDLVIEDNIINGDVGAGIRIDNSGATTGKTLSITRLNIKNNNIKSGRLPLYVTGKNATTLVVCDVVSIENNIIESMNTTDSNYPVLLSNMTITTLKILNNNTKTNRLDAHTLEIATSTVQDIICNNNTFYNAQASYYSITLASTRYIEFLNNILDGYKRTGGVSLTSADILINGNKRYNVLGNESLTGRYYKEIFGNNNVVTYGTTAPSSGTWIVGDRCINSNPSVGQPKGWICTVAGTSGTWVSEGNL